jgi:hypothetical protein
MCYLQKHKLSSLRAPLKSVKMQRIKVLIKEKAKRIPKVPLCMNDFKHEDGCLLENDSEHIMIDP